MKIVHVSVAISLCVTLTHACSVMAEGTIRFEGAIVERGCSADRGQSSRLILNSCPALSGTPVLNVHGIDSISATAPVTLKRVAESARQAGYYEQQFELVDGTGAPIRSGNYLITMTLP